METYKWFLLTCGSKNGHPKNICLVDIGLCVKNFLTILDSMVNILFIHFCDLVMAPWPPLLKIHTNAGWAPHFSVIELGFLRPHSWISQNLEFANPSCM